MNERRPQALPRRLILVKRQRGASRPPCLGLALFVKALDRGPAELADIFGDLRLAQLLPRIPACRQRLALGRQQGATTNPREVDQVDMLVPRADILEQNAVWLWQNMDRTKPPPLIQQLDVEPGLLAHLANRGLIRQLVWVDVPARRKPLAELTVQEQQRPAMVDDERRGGEVARDRHSADWVRLFHRGNHHNCNASVFIIPSPPPKAYAILPR